MPPDLTRRNRQDELMDAAEITADTFADSLRGLRRVNAFTFSTRILWPALVRFAHLADGPLRVLDIGSGAGDGPIALARRSRRSGIEMEFAASDINPHAVDFIQSAAAEAGVEVRATRFDVVTDDFPSNFDVIMSSLFLHHLEEDLATGFLTKCREAARLGVVVHDLERSRAGYWLARYGVRLLSRSHVVHVDGPRSVEGSFTRDELLALAAAAGMQEACVSRRVPGRLLLTWERR